MADKDNMSVDEILAACRNMDGDGSSAAAEPAAAEPSSPPASAPESTEAPAAAPSGKKPGEMSVADMLAAARAEKTGAGEKPAEAKKTEAKPAAAAGPAKKPGEMSVADMLAAARAEKSGPAASASPKVAAAAKPKAAPKGGKASPKPAAKKPAGPMDTSSILAAARKADKPGPISKAEAAARKEGEAKTAGKPAKQPPVMPAKPAYVAPVAGTKADAPDATRRGMLAAMSAMAGVFLGSFLATGFTSLGVVFGLWGLGFARFMFPNILTEPPNQFKVGFPTDFAPDTVETKFKAQYGVWIVNAEHDGQREIAALKSVCTHLGCTPNWLEAEQKFKCPCHGSGFYKDGINFEGPAPRPLERYAISVADDGQLQVDKSRKFQEEMGQWADTASFVPA